MASGAAKNKTAAGKQPAASKKSGSTAKQKQPAAKTKQPAAKTRSTAVKKETVVIEQRGETTNPLIIKEAVLWLVLAVCILIFISYIGFGGYVGEVVSDISFGIFGFFAYLFPFLLFLACAFMISNKGNRLAGIKVSACAGMYVCICSFATLFTRQYELASGAAELYERSAAYKTGGGVIGGMICSFFCKALGALGTGIVLFIFMIICMVLITQRSLIRMVKKQGTRMVRSARESSERRRTEQKEEIHYANTGFSRMPVKERRSVPQESRRRMRRDREEQAVKEMRARRNGRPGQPSAETQPQLDIPVSFPVHTREYRMEHRVSGVTRDTKIPANKAPSGADLHEIQLAPMQQEKEDSVQESYYIDLEKLNRSQAHSSPEPSFAGQRHFEQKSSVAGRADQSIQMEFVDSKLDRQVSSMERDFVGQELEVQEQQEMQEFQELHIEGIDPGDARSDSADTGFYDVPQDSPVKATEPVHESEEEILQEPEAVQDGKGTEAGKAQTAKSASHEESVGKRNPRSTEQEIAEGIASVEEEMAKTAETVKLEYIFPPLDLLKKGKSRSNGGQEQKIRETAAKLQQTLNSFGVHVTVTNVSCGPSVTRYELMPEQGVKVSRIVALADDIKLNLAAADIRIEAPIPGKAAVGIEVPNAENSAVALRDLLESDEFQNHKSKLAFATGKDIGGKVVVSDIAKMPHLLVAGATGSGKSVCMNTIIMSILYKAHPDEVKLIMIDPKVVELSVYNGIPHLFIPVVTDPKKAAGALNWAVAEMTDRYNKFAEYGVRDLKGYNSKIEALDGIEDENKPKKLPQIVIIVDELADLMMVAPGEVEDAICRLAQLARACGIHLIIATQRPSVNVITGLIKANMPSRIAFSVSSGVDSRTIIDMNGAEKLLGKGDMLFYPQGYTKPARVQGAFVSDEEVAEVVDFLKNKNTVAAYNAEMEEQIAKVQLAVSASRGAEDTDALFADAGKFIIDKDKASIGMLQRVFKIGFNRAARIMDQLSDAGVVGPEEGTKPRKILMSMEQFENYLEENG